jgi:uncharacterized protein (TIGR02646 family)
MIKLKKQPEPDLLSRNKTQWTNELISYINNGQKVPDYIKNRYNHSEIKSVLKIETNGGKCMYCESPIAAVAPEHIEHYRPKATYPHLTFEWNNLGLSCPKCNMKKGNVFDENCTYINPYIDLPNDHFIFSSTMIFHIPNDKRAQLTEFQLDLNRLELIEARKHRIDAIRPLIDQYVAENNPTLKAILKKEIDKEIAEDKPYSMYAKAVCKMMIST